MKQSYLFTWIGQNDISPKEGKKGPVIEAVSTLKKTYPDLHLVLLDDRPDKTEHLKKRLSRILSKDHLHVYQVTTENDAWDPTRFDLVFDTMKNAVKKYTSHKHKEAQRLYLIGPGTPTMNTVTLLIAHKSGYYAHKIWQSDFKSPKGIREIELPIGVCVFEKPAPYAQLRTKNLTVSQDSQMQDIYERATLAAQAQTDLPIMILGESGVGKEKMAFHIHKSRNEEAPFMAVNCGALPDTLFESELFGYTQGSFTGATKDRQGIFVAAKEGTVFLDEIGELPLHQQAKLLRVLQERKVTPLGGEKEKDIKCRIIVATHRNLVEMVEKGTFREDLYYRLSGFIIHIPPLRERKKDLKNLINIFWKELVKQNPAFPARTLSKGAMVQLLHYHWPGNIRQLRQVLIQALFQSKSSEVPAQLIETILAQQPGSQKQPISENPPLELNPNETLKEYCDRIKRQLVLKYLSQGLTQSEIAQKLKVAQSTISKLKHKEHNGT